MKDGSVLQDLNAEMAVLGALMLDNSAMSKVEEVNLLVDDFYKTTHKSIFGVITWLISKGKSADVVTVSAKLRESTLLEEVGGTYYLTELVESVPSAENVRYYAEIVKEKARLRKLKTLALEISEKAEHAIDSASIVDFALTEVLNINSTDAEKSILYGNFYESRVKLMRQRLDAETRYFPKTPWAGLNELLVHGFRPGIVLIAGRPGTGKTELKLNLEDHWLKDGIGIYDWSPEMGAARELDRLDLIHLPEIDSVDMYYAKVKKEYKKKLKERWKFYDSKDFWFDDVPDRSFEQIALNVRRIKQGGSNLRIVLIDMFSHLREISTSIRNRREVIESVITRMDIAAKEQEVCYVVLHHLGKQVERRQSTVPKMSDLLEATRFEGTADLILFCHRPAVYDANCGDDTTHVIIGKQREGGKHVGKVVRLRMIGDHKFVEDIESDGLI